MGRWLMNGVDISDTYGVYLKKGAYDALMNYPSMKEYMTEDVREENGERILFSMPRTGAMDVTIPVYLVADSRSEWFTRYEGFLRFLVNAGIMTLHLNMHNRNYRMIYQSCEVLKSLRRQQGRMYSEIDLVFRIPDTHNVTYDDVLLSEGGTEILTEGGDNITISINVFND